MPEDNIFTKMVGLLYSGRHSTTNLTPSIRLQQSVHHRRYLGLELENG